MAELPESLTFQGISIDVLFGPARPKFGDLFLICGQTHPAFAPSGLFGFDSIADLQFEQVDDFFAVRAASDEGADVAIWLYPLVGTRAVHHHAGPFDGVRLEYNVLRNPIRRADHFIKCVAAFANFGSRIRYRDHDLALGPPPDLSMVRNDIDAVAQHWRERGIVVGSEDALGMDGCN